jgi:hypothetical protein
MAGRITIDAALLDAHAANVEGVAADVRTAIQAATQTMLSAGAFGLMNAWMIPPFLGVAGAATATLVSAADALDQSAKDIRAVGRDFDRFEERTAKALSRIAGEIDG